MTGLARHLSKNPFNPARDITLNAGDVKRAHRITGSGETN